MSDIDPRYYDPVLKKHRHNWSCGGGYLASQCCRCRAEAYHSDYGTEYCEDLPAAKAAHEAAEALRKEGRHPDQLDLAEALELARTTFTERQWKLLGLRDKFGEHRVRDRIRV